MFTAPSIVDDPSYGRITILAVIKYDTEQQVIFQDSQGNTTLGFFDTANTAIGRPVRWSKNGSGLYEFDFPGAAASAFVIGPSLNVTSC